MQLTFNIDADQIIDALSRLPIDAKLKLYKKIKSEIREYQLETILDDFKMDDISEDEINEIVEHVRTEAYKNRS
jgi:hypothetical protein